MSEFYIKELTVYGENATTSSVEFSKNLTVITGKSNTGKTLILKCIDYVFGAKKTNNPLEAHKEYTNIEIVLKSKFGTLTLNRKINSNDINIDSNDERIRSGKYNATPAAKNSISDVLLTLIGIEPPIKIIKNSSFERKKLTWRTFWHMMLLDENSIIQESSILMPEVKTENTAFLSSLIYLIWGNNFPEETVQESQEKRKLRHSAIKNYITKLLNKTTKKYNNLKSDIDNLEDIDVEIEIKNLNKKLDDFTQKMRSISKEIKELTSSLVGVNDELTENKLTLVRYQKLMSQYISDVERLNFITECRNAIVIESKEITCPFCDNKFVEKKDELHLVTQKELEKTLLKIEDLTQIIDELKENIKELEEHKSNYEAKKSDLENKLNLEYLPKVDNVKDRIEQHQIYIKLENELKTILEQQNSLQKDLSDLEMEEKNTRTYKPKERFSNDFWNDLNLILKRILEKCEYPNYSGVRFTPEDFDIRINEKKKRNEGKGFRAFFNTTLILALREYMYEHATYNIQPFIIDTPLLGLDEVNDEEKPSESMAYGLFKYFIQSNRLGQLIIVENTKTLPEINLDYEGVKHIHFTKEENNGRYGFLKNIYDK